MKIQEVTQLQLLLKELDTPTDNIIPISGNTSATFTERTGGANPFNGVDIGSYAAPTFADIDSDSDFDAFIGELTGNINYYENTGSNASATFTEKTGTNSPFNGVDIGSHSVPVSVDINNDNKVDFFIGESDGTINYFKSGTPNTLPTASNVAISGTKLVGQSLTGSYDYADGDSDSESGTTYKWYRADDSSGTNASAITGATSKTYTTTSSDGDKYLLFSVTPKDGKDFGSETNSTYTLISSNTLPTASNVAISGTKTVSQSLTGSYDYADGDSDSESGTTYKWYRADDSSGTNVSAITGATSKTYTTTSSDGDKYLLFSVTPKDGKGFGSETNSSYSLISHITTPTAFSFTDVTNQELSTTITSNQITVSGGITKAVAISITGSGCEYLIANTIQRSANTYTSTAGTVSNGAKVDIKVTSSSNYSTTTNCTLTIGGVSDTFRVTTKAEPYTPTDNIIPISGFDGDVNVPQTVTPVELDDKTTQFNVDNQNSNTNTVVNIPPENSDKKDVDITISANGNETKISAPKDAKFSVKTDGSITQSMTIENTKVEISAKSSGQTEIKKETKSESKIVSLPAGANINMSENSAVLGIKEIVADVRSAEKQIEIKATSNPNEELKVIAIVENQTFSLNTREESYEAKMELMEKSSTSRETNKVVYSGIKSTFKSKKAFKVIEDSKLRDKIDGENVEISPLTGWQKFEEKQYFDGKRTITLLMGGAKIIRDGIEEIMIKDTEYELIPSNEQTTTTNEESVDNELIANQNESLPQIYSSDSYLNIQKGWNLLSNPTNEPLNIITIFKYATESFKYDGLWIKNPQTINQNEGIWINYSRHVSEKIEGESYYSDFTNATSGWNLFGAGKDINLNELNSFNEIWAYNAKDKKWIKNPTTIKRGYGFWAK